MRTRLFAPLGLFTVLFCASLACTKETTPAASDDAGAAVPTAATSAPPAEPAPTGTTPTPTPQPQAQTRDAGADAAKDASADAAAGDAGKTDAGATDAGKSDAGGPIAACLAKCQQVLASCLQPQAPKDGGLMTLGDPTKCKAAQDACVAACK